MKASHTPGPWHVAPMTHSVYDSNGDRIAQVLVQRVKSATQANARLIAESPALRATLEQIRELTENATGGMHAEIHELASAALEKLNE